jgi:ketosteroid isomerase-like protein
MTSPTGCCHGLRVGFQFLGAFSCWVSNASVDSAPVDRESTVVAARWSLGSSHGKVLATGASYDNRFVSIVTIENRKIVRWRDYMDSLAAWTALNKS